MVEAGGARGGRVRKTSRVEVGGGGGGPGGPAVLVVGRLVLTARREIGKGFDRLILAKTPMT